VRGGAGTHVDAAPPAGDVVYRLTREPVGGEPSSTVVRVHVPVAAAASLRVQARPNPFASATRIRIDGAALDAGGPVRVDLFDAQGRHVVRLVDRTLPRAVRSVLWDGRDASGGAAPSGACFCRVSIGDVTGTHRLLRQR